MTSTPPHIDGLPDIADDAPTLPGRRVRVVLTDGTEFVSRITNRDYLAWDMTAPKRKWGHFQSVPFLFASFLAWTSAKREGLTDLPWEQFSETADVVETLEEEAARPTLPAPADGSA